MPVEPEHWLEVGRIIKAHGLRGEVVVDLITDRAERRVPGAELRTSDGVLVIASVRPHQQRWLMTFGGVGDRSAAERLSGTVLSAPALPSEDDGEVWAHEVIGQTLVDADGVERGTVTALQSNPASDLLVLDSGHLVPLTFVVELGPPIVADVPPGLFDL